MKRAYQSNFANYILDFIGHRVAMGYKENTYRGSLQLFDKMCLECFPEENTITERILKKWSERKTKEAKNTSYNKRIHAIKQLCLFIREKGQDVEGIVFLVPIRKQVYLPNLYDQLQISYYLSGHISECPCN